MEVLQIIQGREAVPVRAIPFLADWKILSPDKVARILAGEDDFWPTLNAYRLQPDGIVRQILPRWWASWVVGKLKATSNAIEVQQISQAVGHEQWKRESIAQLPAGVFVWRDEFEAAHLLEYGALSMRARSAPKTFDASTYALDFNPEPPPDIAPQHLVLEGFAPANPKAATPASVVAASDGHAPVDKIVHSTKTRRNTLTPVIEQAQKQCIDPQDTAAVWAALLVLAEKKTAPLIGATEDGLQYLKNGAAASFTRNALRQRLGR